MKLRTPEIPSFVIANPEFPSFVIATQVIVAFTSSLPRNETEATTSGAPSFKKREITSFIVDAPYEPWNEFLLQGSGFASKGPYNINKVRMDRK